MKRKSRSCFPQGLKIAWPRLWLHSACPDLIQENTPSKHTPASTQDGHEDLYDRRGAKPHLKSICFILNWYLGPWLQLTNTMANAIEISRLKIALLGVAQSEYHILLLNEPLIPWAQWRAPPVRVCVCVRGRAWGEAGLYVFAGRWGYFSSHQLKPQWGQSQE